MTRGGEFRQVMKPGVVFGELAILYNCTRTATVEAISHTKVKVLLSLYNFQTKHEHFSGVC